MQSVLDGTYRCQDERFEVGMSIDLCWKLIPVLLAYCCDILDKKHMSVVRHGSMVSQAFI